MYERPADMPDTAVDPDAPGVLGLLRGERGGGWQLLVGVGIPAIVIGNLAAAILIK